jgi:hypothetical protein
MVFKGGIKHEGKSVQMYFTCSAHYFDYLPVHARRWSGGIQVYNAHQIQHLAPAGFKGGENGVGPYA